MDSDVNIISVGFLSLNAFDINDKLFAVDLDNFADLVTFVVTTNNLKSIIYFSENLNLILTN